MSKARQAISHHRQPLTFAIVGALNTLLDILLFTAIVKITNVGPTGLGVAAANSISISCVMMVSFFLNKKFVFRASHVNHHRRVLFFVITIIGMYGINNTVLQLIAHHNSAFVLWFDNVLALVGLGFFRPEFLTLITAKIGATAASMIWNYFMYRQFVFCDETEQ